MPPNKKKVTRERIRQVEFKALRKLRARQAGRLDAVLRDYHDGDMEVKQLAGRVSMGTNKSL